LNVITLFGHVGATGIILRIHRDVTLKVEKIMPDSPADGKFKKGEIIMGKRPKIGRLCGGGRKR